MPSKLDRAIQTYRAALLSHDVAALSTLETAYTDALDRLRPMIALVQAEVAGLPAGSDANAVYRLARYQELQRQLESDLRRLARLGSSQAVNGQARMLTLGADAALGLAEAQGGARLVQSWVRVPTGAMEQLMGRMSDGSPLADLFDAVAPDALAVARKELAVGLALGKHPSVVADALTKALTMSKHRAMTISRDSMLNSYREANRANFQANRDILRGYRRTCAKSPRTCGTCLALDGTVHSVDEPMDLHPRDRCVGIPLVIGAHIRIEDGADWFDRQSAEVQDGILGIEAGAAYRDGDVMLADFVKPTESERWGPGTTTDSLVGAKARAERRERRAAA